MPISSIAKIVKPETNEMLTTCLFMDLLHFAIKFIVSCYVEFLTTSSDVRRTTVTFRVLTFLFQFYYVRKTVEHDRMTVKKCT